MAIIYILAENSYDFLSNEDGLQVSQNNFVDIILQDGQEYSVTWKSPAVETDYTYSCIARIYENSIYLGNFSLLNIPITDLDYSSVPFLLKLANGYLDIYTNESYSSVYSISISYFEDTSENVVIRDPLGNEVAYGEYDIVTLSTTSGTDINYYKLPTLEDSEKNKILMSQEGLWQKTDFPQPNWIETDINNPSFIRNKPEKFISEQADWNEENPEEQSYINNKPSLKDLQADWNETNENSYSFIRNKPEKFAVEQVQANWEETDETSPAFILNKPTSFEGGGTQSNWDDINPTSFAFIQNKPFGLMPYIVPHQTYNFIETSISNIYIWSEGEINYIPDSNVDCRIYWDGTYYTLQKKSWSGTTTSGNYKSVYGIGNASLLLIGEESFNPDDTIIDVPFFIDLDNKIVYSSQSGEIEIWAKLYSFKKLDSKYLNGTLLPNVTTDDDGQIMLVHKGSWTMDQPLQSDWNTLSTLLGSFIKNKPFGELPNVISGVYAQLSYNESTGLGGGFMGHTLEESRIIIGKTYTVIFDDTEYQCKCLDARNYNQDRGYIFGNLSLNGLGTNTGEPFMMWLGLVESSELTVNGVKAWLGMIQTNINLTKRIEFFINDGAYTKINSKYLPLDTTMTKSNYAADAAAVGQLVSSFEAIIEEQNAIIAQLRSQIYNLSVRLDALDGGSSTPEASVVNETLIVKGSESNEGLILTYGYVDGETLIFDTSSGSAAVTEDELNVSGSVDTTDDTLNASGVVTTDGVWEV